MRNILIKYLKENEDKVYQDVLSEILSKNMSGKSAYKFALENIKEDSFIQKLNDIVDVGVYESIDNLKKSTSYYKNELKNKLVNLQKMSQINEDTEVLPSYLNVLEANRYDSVFKEEMKSITESLNENRRFMAIANFYLSLQNERFLNKRINEAKEILFEMLVEDSETNESRFINVAQDLTYDKTISRAVNFLLSEKQSLIVGQNDFAIANVTGIFETIDENVYVLHTENRNLLYNEEDKTVSDLKEEVELSNEFKSLSKLLDKGVISITETVNIHANKFVSINDETKDVLVEGKLVKLVENNLPYTLIQKYGVSQQFIPTFEYVYENLDKFVSFDTAKKIQHKQNKDLNVVVFKMDEKDVTFGMQNFLDDFYHLWDKYSDEERPEHYTTTKGKHEIIEVYFESKSRKGADIRTLGTKFMKEIDKLVKQHKVAITWKDNKLIIASDDVKIKESLFSFKTNKKVNKNYEVESYNPSELRDSILEFIKFDIKQDTEIFENLFLQEATIEKRRKEILAQIDKLEKELEKIETAETEEDLEDDSLTEAKEVIKNHIINLREQLVSEKIDMDEYVEVEIKGKKGVFYVAAEDYTGSGKSDELTVLDKDEKKFTELKKNIKPVDGI